MQIYVKASKIYHMKLVKICETLFCHTIILTNRFYIVNKSAQTTNLLYTLCVEFLRNTLFLSTGLRLVPQQEVQCYLRGISNSARTVHHL